MVDIQSAAAEIRRGIKKIDRKKPQGKNIMSASATQGGHKNQLAQKKRSVLVGESSPEEVTGWEGFANTTARE